MIGIRWNRSGWRGNIEAPKLPELTDKWGATTFRGVCVDWPRNLEAKWFASNREVKLNSTPGLKMSVSLTFSELEMRVSLTFDLGVSTNTIRHHFDLTWNCPCGEDHAILRKLQPRIQPYQSSRVKRSPLLPKVGFPFMKWQDKSGIEQLMRWKFSYDAQP